MNYAGDFGFSIAGQLPGGGDGLPAVNVADAVAYVVALEAGYECDDETARGVVLWTREYVLDGLPVVDVETALCGTWTVWREPDGRIYGEC